MFGALAPICVLLLACTLGEPQITVIALASKRDWEKDRMRGIDLIRPLPLGEARREFDISTALAQSKPVATQSTAPDCIEASWATIFA